MARRDDGGPCCPTYHTTGAIIRPEGGLSRRDQFAAAALMGLANRYGLTESAADVATWSVRLADALLDELDLTLDLADPADEGD